jgi:hypothetical protein
LIYVLGNAALIFTVEAFPRYLSAIVETVKRFSLAVGAWANRPDVARLALAVPSQFAVFARVRVPLLRQGGLDHAEAFTPRHSFHPFARRIRSMSRSEIDDIRQSPTPNSSNATPITPSPTSVRKITCHLQLAAASKRE